MQISAPGSEPRFSGAVNAAVLSTDVKAPFYCVILYFLEEIPIVIIVDKHSEELFTGIVYLVL